MLYEKQDEQIGSQSRGQKNNQNQISKHSLTIRDFNIVQNQRKKETPKSHIDIQATRKKYDFKHFLKGSFVGLLIPFAHFKVKYLLCT